MCQHYGACPNVAIQTWLPSFSCECCPDYLGEAMDPAEIEQQASACAALIMAILNPGVVKHGNRRKLIDSLV